LIANLVVLLGIILLPISTRILSAGPLSTTSSAVYSANLLATSVAEFFFRRLATQLSVPEGVALPASRVPRALGSCYAMTIHSCSLIAAFIHPWLSVVFWVLAFATPLIERRVYLINEGGGMPDPELAQVSSARRQHETRP
jgi:uncharacterized membrane protein